MLDFVDHRRDLLLQMLLVSIPQLMVSNVEMRVELVNAEVVALVVSPVLRLRLVLIDPGKHLFLGDFAQSGRLLVLEEAHEANVDIPH